MSTTWELSATVTGPITITNNTHGGYAVREAGMILAFFNVAEDAMTAQDRLNELARAQRVPWRKTDE